MRNPRRVAASLLIVVSCVLGAVAAAAAVPAAEAPAKRFVCAPCGMPCDSVVYDKPGTCPTCGAALVDQDAAADAVSGRRKVGILIFTGVEIIDYTGPYEVFGQAGLDVYTVAETREAVTTAMGMTVVPRYAFAEAPQPDVLVVPGGGIRAARGSAATLKWVADAAAHAQITMSVCNGAFILGSAGLLDGLTVTTTSGRIDELRAEFPRTRVVADQRLVDNGKIITTAGLSAGIDGALHVVERMLGKGAAQGAALGLEYDWRPASGYARAALADRLIPAVDLDAIGKWSIVETDGGTDRWVMVVRGTSARSAAEVMDHVGREFVQGKWTRLDAAAGSSSATRSDWRFRAPDGRPWSGTLSIESAGGAGERQYTLRLSIAHAG